MSNFLLNLLLIALSPIQSCYVDQNRDVRFEDTPLHNDSIRLLTERYESNETVSLLQGKKNPFQFEKIIWENCYFVELNSDDLRFDFEFKTLIFDNVDIKHIESDAFKHIESIDRLIHRNSHLCPSLKELLESIGSLQYLRFIEICSNHRIDLIDRNQFGDVLIPKYSIDRLRNIEQIHFHSTDFSRYSIDSFAFDSNHSSPSKLISIIFERIHFVRIGSDALTIQKRQFDVNDQIQFLSIFFKDCRFTNFTEVFHQNFSQSSTVPIRLTIRPQQPIRLQTTLDVFENFLGSSRNYLALYEVLCNDDNDDDIDRTNLTALRQQYDGRIDVFCFNDSSRRNDSNLSSSLSLTINVDQIDSLELLFESIDRFETPSQWFQQFDHILIETDNRDQTKIMFFVESIPNYFDYDHVENDIVFQQKNTEIRIQKIAPNSKGTTIYFVDFDSIEINLYEDHFDDEVIDHHHQNHHQNDRYYIIRTRIRIDPIRSTFETGINSDVISYTVWNADENRSFHTGIRLCYWNQTVAKWLRDGCVWLREQSNSTVTLCQCNHLTSFAILLDISGRESSSQPNRIKQYLTRICCAGSIFGLIVSICLMWYMSRDRFHLQNDQFRWRINRWIITLNISLCLLIINLLTAFGIDRKANEEICMSISAVLLFFLLSSFSFMLLQGYHLFKSTINPLVYDWNFIYYLLVGYGTPGLLVLIFFITILANNAKLSNVLISEFYCWISSEKNPNYFLIVIVPVTLTIMVNIVFFILLLINLIRRSNFLQRNIQFDRHKPSHKCRQILSLGLLAVNLGFTWLLFLMYISEHMHYFSYLFIVINGSQGLFFLINQIMLLRAKDRYKLKRTGNLKKKLWTSDQIGKSSTSALHSTTASSSFDSVSPVSTSKSSISSTCSLIHDLTNRLKNF
ncbi:Latrophilin-like protein LAT-2 [Sarcoptes scabiei]|uniref:Latrophilin-like protein LAT-2 n=2 Tax=Sarcoptes scabiei TaxID=52283 RepID=A0A834VEB8_SARSC|nr:Latrophilin-like protein LAT-2 [Sarcoptes scabiei]